MKTPEHNADLFPATASPAASADSASAEIRFRADEMTVESSCDSRAASGIGARLCEAREARGMDLKTCAQTLRLPVKVLRHLEAGEFGDADQHVFARGRLISYARLLGVPAAAVDTALHSLAPPQQPVLVPTGSAQRHRWLLQRYGAAATYIVLTATVAVPLVWLGLRGGVDNQLTRIAPLDNAPAASINHAAPDNKIAATPTQEPPLLASMTPFSAMNLDANDSAAATPAKLQAQPAAVATDHVLDLRASADSWVEVTGADGKTLESGMLRAGEQRSYHSNAPLNVTLGNAGSVQVISDGRPLPLDAYSHANVAHFRVFAPASAIANG